MLRELSENFYPVTQDDDEHERRIAEERRAYYHRAIDTVAELCQRRQRQEPEVSGYWVSKVEDVLRNLRHEVEAIGERD